MDIPLIILAAGRSKRMGEPKALLSNRGEPWIVQQIKTFRKFSPAMVIVVLSENILHYKQILSCFSNIHIVENRAYEMGTFNSIHLALKVGDFAHGVFVKPVDVPLENNNVFRRIVEFIRSQKIETPKVVKVKNSERGGHPLYLSLKFIEQLRHVNVQSGDARLDLQIRRLSQNEKTVLELDEYWISLNLNTPADWQNFQTTIAKSDFKE